jgi:hypothetical protein
LYANSIIPLDKLLALVVSLHHTLVCSNLGSR